MLQMYTALLKEVPISYCGSLPRDTPTGYQIATEVTLTQIGIQATASYQDDTEKLACTVASSVFTWVRLKAVNETTRISYVLTFVIIIIIIIIIN
jgi:hypothetical protein